MEIFAIIQIECRSPSNPSLILSRFPFCHGPHPTSVSVKLLTPCHQWRRAYLDPVDGWVLVDLSHTNIFLESAESRGACAYANLSTRTHTSACEHITRLGLSGSSSPSPADTKCLQFRPRWVER